MVNLLFADDTTAHPARHRPHPLRPRLRHRRHAVASPRSTCASSTPTRHLEVFGQELTTNPTRSAAQRHAHQGPGHREHQFGDSFTDDGFPGEEFDYMLANPPFGVEWKRTRRRSETKHESTASTGRFGAGLPAHQRRLLPVPPAHDLQDEADPQGRRQPHRPSSSTAPAVHRRRRVAARARSAAGSSRTTGSRPSSRCRTSSSTTPASSPTSGSSPTAKPTERRGKVQLIDAVRSLHEDAQEPGNKRNEIGDEQRRRDHAALPGVRDGEHSKIFANDDFGYRQITSNALAAELPASPGAHRAAQRDGVPEPGEVQEEGQGRRGRDRGRRSSRKRSLLPCTLDAEDLTRTRRVPAELEAASSHDQTELRRPQEGDSRRPIGA